MPVIPAESFLSKDTKCFDYNIMHDLWMKVHDKTMPKHVPKQSDLETQMLSTIKRKNVSHNTRKIIAKNDEATLHLTHRVSYNKQCLDASHLAVKSILH